MLKSGMESQIKNLIKKGRPWLVNKFVGRGSKRNKAIEIGTDNEEEK